MWQRTFFEKGSAASAAFESELSASLVVGEQQHKLRAFENKLRIRTQALHELQSPTLPFRKKFWGSLTESSPYDIRNQVIVLIQRWGG
jgi:hypothetical protein